MLTFFMVEMLLFTYGVLDVIFFHLDDVLIFIIEM